MSESEQSINVSMCPCCGATPCECGACANATSRDTIVLTITGVTQVVSPPPGLGCCSGCEDVNGSYELNKCCEPNAADGSCVWALTQVDENGDCDYINYSKTECAAFDEDSPSYCFPNPAVQLICFPVESEGDYGYYASAVISTVKRDDSPCNFGPGSAWTTSLSFELAGAGDPLGTCDCHEFFLTEQTLTYRPDHPGFPNECCDMTSATCTIQILS